MSETPSTKVITGKVRFCYANVFVPTSIEEGGTKKYNISILIPKSDTVTIKKITDAVEAALQLGMEKVGKNGKVAPNLKMPLRDGDAERPDDSAYEGMMFVNANSTRKPEIVDKDREPIMSNDEFYSGCFGRASLNFYAYNASGNKGIACGLNNLQKLEDGEILAGGSSAEDDFADDDDLTAQQFESKHKVEFANPLLYGAYSSINVKTLAEQQLITEDEVRILQCPQTTTKIYRYEK